MKPEAMRWVLVCSAALWGAAGCNEEDGASDGGSDAAVHDGSTTSLQDASGAGEGGVNDGSVLDGARADGDTGAPDAGADTGTGVTDAGIDAGNDAGSDAASDAGQTSDGQVADAGVRQIPPTASVTELEAWLETREYERWSCEDSVHANRSPSPHGYNRICVNDAVSAAATGTGPWPVGAAAVKELYTSADAAEPAGYAVSVKMSTTGGESNGADWYWFERWTNGAIFADGMGVGGCTGCHDDAGSAGYVTSAGSRDDLFTPVP